jgi:hypothetical protein
LRSRQGQAPPEKLRSGLRVSQMARGDVLIS